MESTPRFHAAITDELLDRYLLGRATHEEQRTIEERMHSVPGFTEWVAAIRKAKAPQEELIQVERVRRRIREDAELGMADRSWVDRGKGNLPLRGKSRIYESLVGRAGGKGRVGSRTLRPSVANDLDTARAAVSKQIASGSLHATAAEGSVRKTATSPRTRRAGVWAGVLSVAIVGLVFFARGGGETHSGIAHVYATQAYQQGILNLDDGTRVTLAPQTRLRVPPFGMQRRTVVLESGEAYFEVAHASGAPFVVHSGTTTTQVLGTSFLIRYALGNAYVRVSVANGKVRVITPTHAGAGVTLTTGQIGDVTDSITHVTTADEGSPSTEWTSGSIIFRDTPLSKVLQTVSQWYGYRFRYADQTLGARSVTIGISTRSSAEALAALERVLLVNFTFVGDTVTLVPRSSLSNRHAPQIRTYDVWSPAREVGR